MRAVTIDSDLATLFTFTPRKPPITPIQEVRYGSTYKERKKEHRHPKGGIGGRHAATTQLTGILRRGVWC